MDSTSSSNYDKNHPELNRRPSTTDSSETRTSHALQPIGGFSQSPGPDTLIRQHHQLNAHNEKSHNIPESRSSQIEKLRSETLGRQNVFIGNVEKMDKCNIDSTSSHHHNRTEISSGSWCSSSSSSSAKPVPNEITCNRMSSNSSYYNERNKWDHGMIPSPAPAPPSSTSGLDFTMNKTNATKTILPVCDTNAIKNGFSYYENQENNRRLADATSSSSTINSRPSKVIIKEKAVMSSSGSSSSSNSKSELAITGYCGNKTLSNDFERNSSRMPSTFSPYPDRPSPYGTPYPLEKRASSTSRVDFKPGSSYPGNYWPVGSILEPKPYNMIPVPTSYHNPYKMDSVTSASVPSSTKSWPDAPQSSSAKTSNQLHMKPPDFSKFKTSSPVPVVTPQKFNEIREKYNYIPDLQLKNPPAPPPAVKDEKAPSISSTQTHNNLYVKTPNFNAQNFQKPNTSSSFHPPSKIYSQISHDVEFSVVKQNCCDTQRQTINKDDPIAFSNPPIPMQFPPLNSSVEKAFQRENPLTKPYNYPPPSSSFPRQPTHEQKPYEYERLMNSSPKSAAYSPIDAERRTPHMVSPSIPNMNMYTKPIASSATASSGISGSPFHPYPKNQSPSHSQRSFDQSRYGYSPVPDPTSSSMQKSRKAEETPPTRSRSGSLTKSALPSSSPGGGGTQKSLAKPNYREMINHVYSQRSATSERDLNMQIIKRALNCETATPTTRKSESDLSRNIFDSPEPNKFPTGCYDRQFSASDRPPPVAPVSNLLRENDVIVTAVKPAPVSEQKASKSKTDLTSVQYPPAQFARVPLPQKSSADTKTIIAPIAQIKTESEISVSSVSSTKRGSFFSPLDLSVKTVKTPADSTGCVESSTSRMRGNARMLIGSSSASHLLPKVDFTPNFSKHTTSPANEANHSQHSTERVRRSSESQQIPTQSNTFARNNTQAQPQALVAPRDSPSFASPYSTHKPPIAPQNFYPTPPSPMNPAPEEYHREYQKKFRMFPPVDGHFVPEDRRHLKQSSSNASTPPQISSSPHFPADVGRRQLVPASSSAPTPPDDRRLLPQATSSPHYGPDDRRHLIHPPSSVPTSPDDRRHLPQLSSSPHFIQASKSPLTTSSIIRSNYNPADQHYPPPTAAPQDIYKPHYPPNQILHTSRERMAAMYQVQPRVSYLHSSSLSPHSPPNGLNNHRKRPGDPNAKSLGQPNEKQVRVDDLYRKHLAETYFKSKNQNPSPDTPMMSGSPNYPFGNAIHQAASLQYNPMPQPNTIINPPHIKSSEAKPVSVISYAPEDKSSVPTHALEVPSRPIVTPNRNGANESVILKLRQSIETKEHERQRQLQLKSSQVQPVQGETPELEKEEIKPDISAARIRTKGELKGYSVSEAPPVALPSMPVAVIKTEKPEDPPTAPSSPVNLMPASDAETGSAAFDLMDWGSACNNFVEQLLGNAKKRVKKRGKISDIEDKLDNESKDMPGVPCEVDVDKSLVEKIKVETRDVPSSSEEDKPLLFLKQKSVVETEVKQESPGQENEEEKKSEDRKSAEEKSSTNVSEKTTSRSTRGRQRLEQEKRYAARLSKSSSTDSDEEISKRNENRTRKQNHRKPRSRTSAKEMSGTDSSGAEDICMSRNLVRSREEYQRRLRNKSIADDQKPQESPSKSTETKALCAKNSKLSDGKKEDTPLKLTKIEETMTRSKKKKELEMKIANSKVLRNEKIVQNVVVKAKVGEKVDKSDKNSPKTTPVKPKTAAAQESPAKRKRIDDVEEKKLRSGKSVKDMQNQNSSNESTKESEHESLATRLRKRPSLPKPEEKSKKKRDTSAGKKPSEPTKQSLEMKSYPPGWELQVYQFKRALKVPASLITIKGPMHHRVSTSLPDLDPHSSDASENSSINQKTMKTRPRRGAAESESRVEKKPAEKTSEKQPKAVKKEPKEDELEPENDGEPKSIIDVLHSRVLKVKKYPNNKKAPPLKTSELKILPRCKDVELLPTPTKDDENKSDKFQHHSVFETEILKSRTRTEYRILKNKESIREVFGCEERPASAPPHISDSATVEIKTENVTFEQKYEQYLQKMNVDFGRRIRKNKKTSTNENNNDSMATVASAHPASIVIKTENLNETNMPTADDEDTVDTDITSIHNISQFPAHDGDTHSITSEVESSVVAPLMITAIRRKKARHSRRKFSSGFDYIRKPKKKPTPSNSANTSENLYKRRKLIEEDFDENYLKHENDVSKEIQKWVLNKSVGQSTMHRAARLGYIDVIAYCVERMGLNPDPKDNAGYTPLHEACTKGRLDIARVLMQYGANYSETAHSGIRPLHEASENGHVEIVRMLLSFGADPLLTTYSGQTPLMLAEDNEMEQFLKNYLFDVQNTGPHKQPWRFPGPWKIVDVNTCGYDVLHGAPEPDDCRDAVLKSTSLNAGDKPITTDSFDNDTKPNGWGNDYNSLTNKCTVVLNNIDHFDSVKIYKDYHRRKTITKDESDPQIIVEGSDGEGEMFEFEEADMPLPPLYLLKDEGAEKWVLLSDLCNLLKVKSKDTLLKQICPTSLPANNNKDLLRELKISDFLERATCLQLLCAGEKLNIRASKVILVKYNESVKNLLRVKTILMKF